MGRKKKRKDMLLQVEKLVKDKPREFLLGFISLAILFLLSATTAGYLFFQNPPLTIDEMLKIEKKAQEQSKLQYHTLQPGESLWDVAQKYYGDPYLYPTIVQLNNLTSPDLVEPGTRLRVK